MSKPRVIKDYEKLDKHIAEQIKKKYRMGYEKHLIKFKNKAGEMVSSLPFETEDKCYLIKMPAMQKAKAVSDEEAEEPDYEAIIAGSDSSKDEFELDMEHEEE